MSRMGVIDREVVGFSKGADVVKTHDRVTKSVRGLDGVAGPTKQQYVPTSRLLIASTSPMDAIELYFRYKRTSREIHLRIAKSFDV